MKRDGDRANHLPWSCIFCLTKVESYHNLCPDSTPFKNSCFLPFFRVRVKDSLVLIALGLLGTGSAYFFSFTRIQCLMIDD